MEISRFAPVAAFLILGALSACASDRILDSRPSQITIVSGDKQEGVGGAPLSTPLTVAVTTSSGVGVPEVWVAWTTTGGGTLSARSGKTDDQGMASVNWILGTSLGEQSVTATINGTEGSSAVFKANAVGPPIVLHYDGATWSTSLRDNHGAHISLQAVWGASGSDVFVGGGTCSGPSSSGPLIMRYDGTSWVDTRACPGPSLSQVTSIGGNSGTDVFAVERHPLPPSFSSSIVHYNGQSWNEVYRRGCSFCGGLRAVWSSGPTSAIAVGDSGSVLHYDGANWNAKATGATQHLRAVWGASGSGVFAVGDGGTILYYDGNIWRAQTSGTTQPLFAVWGTSSTDVFAVGGAGTILHYDGAAWTAQSSGATQALHGVWGNSASSVFAVGDANTILHYDGTNWTAQAVSPSMNFSGVWGTSATNVFAVGAPK